MALRRPHKRMKMVGRRVFAYCMTVLSHPSLLDSGLRRNDETGRANGCHLFVPIAHAGWPAHQGMKSRSCGLVQRIGTADSATPHPTPAGDKPLAPHYIFSFRHRPSVYNSAGFAGGEPASRLIGAHIPDRSPGHAFVRMTTCGLRTIEMALVG